MKILTIKRWDLNGVDTMGAMRNEDGYFRCFTLERPWKNNLPEVSCIPKGEYRATLNSTSKFGFPVWQLQDVQGRSAIEIHPANLVSQLEGCIALGYSIHHFTKPDEDLEDSREAFNDFMEFTKGETEIRVVILEV